LLDSLLQEIFLSLMMSYLNDLPSEMLLKVLELLGPRDLKAAVLVCKLWRALGEDPRLWTWTVLKICNMEDLQKVNIRRLSRLQEIKVPHKCFLRNVGVECIWKEEIKVNEVFKAIVKIPTVTRISGLGCCTGISGVDPQLLVNVFNRLEKPFLHYLTSEQIALLFSTMAEDTNVKELKVSDHLLSTVNQVVFASAICNVSDVSFVGCRLVTSELLEAVFVVLAKEDRPLRNVIVTTWEFPSCGIDPALLALAVNRMEEVRIYGLWFSAAQITAILRNLVQGTSRLKKLKVFVITDADVEKLIEELDADLVRRAKEKVGKFCLKIFEED